MASIRYRTLAARAAPVFATLVLASSPAVAAAQTGAGAAAPSSPADPALLQAAQDAEVRAFYTSTGWRRVWTEEASRSLAQILADRRRHGLEHLDLSLDAGPGASDAEQEVVRTRAALRYAKALAQGAVDPASLHSIYTLPRPETDLANGLQRAIADGALAKWYETLPPSDDEYRRLSQDYVRISRQAEGASVQKDIAASGLIRVGDQDPRLAEILRRLGDGGFISVTASDEERPLRYDAAAASAVKSLQRAFGIADDGVIGPDTFQVLNLSPYDKARALAVALERRRWLRRSPPSTRIDVNVAAARLRYYRDGRLVDSRKVIVGSPGKETPALLSPIYRLVANPTWTVPKSIQHGELANVGQAYLDSRNMVLRNGWIVQMPGPTNALGLVKFDMVNPYAIYLHDTSAPALFGRSARQLSHGCVRVEDALGFAQMLAEDQGVADAWRRARESGEETFVPLPRRIPVRLLYHSAFVDEGGEIAFRMDPYDWNDPIAKALGFNLAPGANRITADADIGP